MLLPQLHADVSSAVARMRTTNADSTAVVVCVNEIALALTKSDVRPEIVSSLRENLKEIANIDKRDSLRSKLLKIEQVLYKELCQLFYAEVPVYTPEKGKSCVALFLGEGDLQESTSLKYASYHNLRGYETSIVCASRLQYDAFQKFKARSTRAGVLFSDSYAYRDRAVAARLGLSEFRKAKSDIIIVVARDDMLQVARETNPDLVVLTIDASIGGQAVFEQANIFKSKYPSGAVILTSTIAPNAAGAISSVAAAKLPLLYVETGGTDDGLEIFDSKSFVTQHLGLKNKIIEVTTHDFHDLLLDCEASPAEEIALMENLKNAYMEEQTQQLAHYRLLRDEILALGAEYSDLCDLLGEPVAKTTKIKAGSLQDRRDCIVNCLKFLRDTKNERMQKLGTLQRRAQALCQFLGLSIEEHQYHFLSLQVQEVMNVHGLSKTFLNMVQEKVNNMEDLRSKKLTKIFGKMDELDKLLEQESQLKGHHDYELDFTRDAVENGTVGCQVALKCVQDLIDKAVDIGLIKKLISSRAKELLEAQEVISEARLNDTRVTLKRVENWQSKYRLDLCYVDDVNGEKVRVQTELQKLEAMLLSKLRALVALPTSADSGDEMAVSPERRVGENQHVEESLGGSDVDMTSNGPSPEGSPSNGPSPEGSPSNGPSPEGSPPEGSAASGPSPEGSPSDGSSSEQIPSEIDDENKDPDYSPEESDNDMRD